MPAQKFDSRRFAEVMTEELEALLRERGKVQPGNLTGAFAQAIVDKEPLIEAAKRAKKRLELNACA